MKTSIKVKKFWYSELSADGGIGVDWIEAQLGQRESSVQFTGSDADINNFKNVLGSTLESAITKGDKTMNFQLADLTPEVIAAFTGGTVTSDAAADSYDAPENENQVVEKSIKFLSDKNVLFRMTRVSFDGFPSIVDDDLHFYQMNSVVLLPEKAGETSYGYDVLLQPDANDITAFSFVEQDAPAVITGTPTFTVAIDVDNGTDPSALVPTILASLGASIDPPGGEANDFTSAVEYSIESANGVSQIWTVTVTVL